jgi:Secretion system C-terminal sorting domain
LKKCRFICPAFLPFLSPAQDIDTNKQNQQSVNNIRTMKHILLPFLLFFGAGLSAQTTLTQNSFAVDFSNDTVGLFSLNTFPFLQVGTNQVWNLGAVPVLSWEGVFRCGAPDKTNFPNALYAQQVRTRFSNLSYTNDLQYGLDATGWRILGESIKRQAISLQSLSGSSTDSLIVLGQNAIYATPEKILAFPASFGQKDTSRLVRKLNYQLHLPLFGLSFVPVERRSRLTTTLNAVGNGKMRIPLRAGGVSREYDVLMVRRLSITVDSFFLNGVPAPGALLNNFGLMQGQTVAGSVTAFYAAGKWKQPLVLAIHSDGTFGPLSDAIVMGENVEPGPSGVSQPAWAAGFSVSPNPAVDAIRVNIPAEAQGGVLELYDAQGRRILQRNTREALEVIEVKDRPAGVYLLRYSNGQAFVSNAIVLNP